MRSIGIYCPEDNWWVARSIRRAFPRGARFFIQLPVEDAIIPVGMPLVYEGGFEGKPLTAVSYGLSFRVVSHYCSDRYPGCVFHRLKVGISGAETEDIVAWLRTQPSLAAVLESARKGSGNHA